MTSEDVTLLHHLYKIKTDRMCRFRNLKGRLRREKQDVSTVVTELAGEAFRDEKVASVSIVLLQYLTLKSSFSISGFGLHLTVDVKR